jgi:tricorn protease
MRRSRRRARLAAPPAGGAAPRTVAPAATRIDFDGIDQRIVELPIPAASFGSLQVGDAGMVFFTRRADGANALHRYDLAKRKDDTLLPNVGTYRLSADGKKILYSQQGAWFIAGTAVAPTTGQLRLATADIEVRIDPRPEWKQVSTRRGESTATISRAQHAR